MYASKTRQEIVAKISAFLKTVTYKPGAIFKVKENPFEFSGFSSPFVTIAVKLKVTNCFPPHEETAIEGQQSILLDEIQGLRNPAFEQYMRAKVLKLIQDGEEHDAREWLLFGGERVFDPHAGEPPEHIAHIHNMMAEERRRKGIPEAAHV